MKKIVWLMLLNAAFGFIVQAQNFEWAKRAGLWAYDYGYGIVTDNSGNVYVSGKYEMNANFGGTTVSCQGNHDIYVAKYSPQGNLIWVRTAGGWTGDYATSIAIDDSHVYIAGEIEGAGAKITFSNSPIVLWTYGSNDIVLAKYDLNGNLIWAKRAGDIYYDKALGIDVDNSGNVYVCGLFNNKAKFSDNTTIYGYGENDIFLAKYAPNGDFLWAKKAGGTGRDEAKAVKCDAAGNVYIAGMFKYSANFSGTVLNSNGYFDMFLAKYDSNGDLQWVKDAGAAWDEVAWGLTIDNSGKIFIVGEFNSSVNFNGIQLTTHGSADIFVACYNASGNIIWAKRAGGNGIDRARGIGTDGNNIFITGQFEKTASFGSTYKTATDNSDIFFTAMSNSGNFLWTSIATGPNDGTEELGYESGNAITAESNGNVYATGAMLNGGVFGGTTLNPYTRTDIFIAKLKNGSGSGGGGTDGTELISANSSWKYLDDGSNQNTAWRTNSYSDASWKTGNAQLGYGDGDEATIVSYGNNSNNKFITTYFRKTFNVTNASAISGLEISLLRDDGAVIYINGNEVVRNNMPSGTIYYNTLAASSATSSENSYQVANISASSLVNGTNLIAVEMHQHSANSSDLSFNLKLKTVNGWGGGMELISANSSWKYLDDGSNQAASWRAISYNDGSWKNGTAEFGYGDGDEATIVSYGNNSNNKFITTYFRKTFNVTNASAISGLEISLLRDDGAVIYINGNEVVRNNMPSGTIYYNTLAASSATSSENIYQVANISASSLVNGTNLIAVEMHQHSANSSDLSFNLKLRTLSGAKMENPDTTENGNELLSFAGEFHKGSISLAWVMAKELNSDYFILERSVDEENFFPAGIVKGAGNSLQKAYYNFSDNEILPTVKEGNNKFYYRLNQTNFDGEASYSPEILVEFPPSEIPVTLSQKPVEVSLFPNPVSNSLSVFLSELPTGNTATMNIFDINGRKILETIILTNLNQIDVSSFVPGIYLVGIKSENKIIFTEKIMVQ